VIKQAVAFYLGIDGGGSKTACLLGDETSILGRGDSAGSNMVRLGEQAAGEALQQAVRSACANAKVNPAQLTRTVAGTRCGKLWAGKSMLLRMCRLHCGLLLWMVRVSSS